MRKTRLSLLSRMMIFTVGSVLLTGGLAIFLALSGLGSLSSGIVEAVYGRILDAASKSFAAAAAVNYGEFALSGGHLVGDGGAPVQNSSQAVDAMARQSTVEAAILVSSGKGFEIEQTSVRAGDGKRLRGLGLEPGSPATAALAAGSEYRGRISLDGRPYIAAASPILDQGGSVIGALLVGQSVIEVDELTADGYRSVLLRILLGCLASVALSALAAGFALRSSIMPLRRTVSLLEKISADGGDLTRRIEARRSDETGQLAASFNRFAERLRAEFSRMKLEVASLGGNAGELEASSVAAAAAVARISGEIGKVKDRVVDQSASVSESTGAMEQVARTIEALDRRIAEEAGAIEGSSGSIARMASGIETATHRVSALVERVGRLKQASDDGGEAVRTAALEVAEAANKSERLLELNGLIAAVASRTDLLAMNAAIEAAHAGQAGRGFAVVADEMRRLAEETAASSKQAAEELRDVATSIGRIVESSGRAEAAFERIGESVALTALDLASIDLEMTGQRAGSAEVLRSMDAMREATRAIIQGGAEMREGGGEAIAEMQRLLSLSGAIEVSVSAMAAELAAISNQTEMAAQAARRNAEVAAALGEELEPYRT